jgi:hypothetical protein
VSLNAAAIAIMVKRGLTAEDILDVAEALEVKRDRTGAERQARYRDRHKVTRDVTRDAVPPNEELLTPSGTELPNEASASLPIRQPITAALDFWNENAAQVGWSQVRSMSANRNKLLGARLREHGLEGWQAAIAKARASPYLSGSDPPSWFTFPWLIKAENFLKLSEGNYDRKHTDTSDPTTVALAKLHERFGSNGPFGRASQMLEAGSAG